MTGAIGRHFGLYSLVVTAMLATLGGSACSNITRYVQGPQPVTAHPAPTWTISAPPELAEAFKTNPALTFSARVVGIEPGPPPALGFKIYFKDVTPEVWQADSVWISVKAWAPIKPQTTPGGRVTVAVSNGAANEIMILDDNGLIFHAFNGQMFPSADESGPLQFATSHEPAYYQSMQARDLCGQTWIHSKVSVASDMATTTLAPGARARMKGSHNGNLWTWLVASADSTFLDESDCPGEYPSVVFFVMAREGRAAEGVEGVDEFKGLRKISK